MLETERLLKDKETAAGKTKDEATMLLNHKEALDFILNHTNYVEQLTIASIEDLHSILIKDLNVKGSSTVIKGGTKIKNIRLVDGDHDIDYKVDGQSMLLKSEFMKKA